MLSILLKVDQNAALSCVLPYRARKPAKRTPALQGGEASQIGSSCTYLEPSAIDQKGKAQ